MQADPLLNNSLCRREEIVQFFLTAIRLFVIWIGQSDAVTSTEFLKQEYVDRVRQQQWKLGLFKPVHQVGSKFRLVFKSARLHR